MVDISRLDPRVAAMVTGLREKFPQVTLTSGFRDPERNAAVGGARGSQHLHGNAFDFSVRGLPEDQQRAIVQYLRESGAQGFGYYPDSQSIHADIGAPRYWGPDKTSASLNRTPTWFQEIAGTKNPVQVAELPAVQTAAAAPAAATPAAPVYSADLGTAARWLGNTIAPSLVDAPTPLTPDQAKAQDAQIASYGAASKGLGGMASGLLQLAKLAQEPEEKQMPMPAAPQIVRGQFKPLPKMRGLLG